MFHRLERETGNIIFFKKKKIESFQMEKIFSHAWKDKRGINETGEGEGDQGKGQGQIQEEYVDDEQGLQRRHVVDTTLIVHFFGKKGKDELRFEGFRGFMENLQSEVLELEFHEFSKGHNTISEVDFARILLRYTYLDTDEYVEFLYLFYGIKGFRNTLSINGIIKNVKLSSTECMSFASFMANS